MGACKNDTGATDTGGAYVYDLNSGTPDVRLVTLNNPTPGAGDQFGNSVAISGSRIVVGAHADSDLASYAGKAYVYDLECASPAIPIATLNYPATIGYERFGESVAIQ